MNKIIRKIEEKKTKGFTIIESLVAITILMIAVTGPLTISQRSLMASVYAKDQVTAAYLAQDAMEYIKNIKSRYVPPYGDFSGWLTGPSGIATRCTIDFPCGLNTYGAGYIFPTNNPADFDLYNTDTGIYMPNPSASGTPGPTSSSSGNSKTIFSRKFYIDTTNVSNPGNEATVVVIVQWAGGSSSLPNQVKLQSQIFNIGL